MPVLLSRIQSRRHVVHVRHPVSVQEQCRTAGSVAECYWRYLVCCFVHGRNACGVPLKASVHVLEVATACAYAAVWNVPCNAQVCRRLCLSLSLHPSIRCSQCAGVLTGVSAAVCSGGPGAPVFLRSLKTQWCWPRLCAAWLCPKLCLFPPVGLWGCPCTTFTRLCF